MSVEVAPCPGTKSRSGWTTSRRSASRCSAPGPTSKTGTPNTSAATSAPTPRAPAPVVVGAFDGNALVGAATGTPLSDHQERVAAAARDLGLPQSQVFYLAESVLLPAFHGRGIGHAFFDHRERHAKEQGFRYAMFASVIHPEDHPARPATARDLAPSGTAAATRRSRVRRQGRPGATWGSRGDGEAPGDLEA